MVHPQGPSQPQLPPQVTCHPPRHLKSVTYESQSKAFEAFLLHLCLHLSDCNLKIGGDWWRFNTCSNLQAEMSGDWWIFPSCLQPHLLLTDRLSGWGDMAARTAGLTPLLHGWWLLLCDNVEPFLQFMATVMKYTNICLLSSSNWAGSHGSVTGEYSTVQYTSTPPVQ